MPRILPAVLMAAAAAFPANAADWGQLATISSTLGVNANRLCVGEGLRSDIGCPSYAPYVSSSGNVGIGTITPSATLGVHGNIAVGTGSGSPTVSFWGNSDSDNIIKINTNALGTDARWRTSQGTANAPGWSFFSDSDSGIYGDLADGLGIVTGGVARLWVGANGNVGISTTNPNAKLEVNGDISATNLRLSGNLHVSGSQMIDGVTFANGGVSATGIITATSFSGDGSRLTGLASGDRITSGTSSIIATQNQSITFTTANNPRMIVDERGYVGIGTASPQDKLEVGGNIRLNTNATTSPQINFYGNTSTTNRAIAHINARWNPSADASRVGVLDLRAYDLNGNAQQILEGRGTTGGGSTTLFAGNSASVDVSILSNSMFNVKAGASNIFRVYNLNTTGFVSVNGAQADYDLSVFGQGSATPLLKTDASTLSVGIGTSSPAKTLDVSGTAQIISRTLVGGTGAPSATLQVSGSLLLAGNDNIPCTNSALGLVRRNPTTGRLQACR